MSGKRGAILWVLVLGIGTLSVINFFSQPEVKGKETAVVDLTTVFNEFDMKKELQTKLEREISQKKTMIDSLMFKLSLAKSKAEAPDATDQIKWDYQQLQNYFFQEKRAFEEYSVTQTNNYDSQILKQMSQYIKDYGEEKGFKLILGKNESGNVLYGDEPSNITKEVIEAINSKYQGKD